MTTNENQPEEPERPMAVRIATDHETGEITIIAEYMSGYETLGTYASVEQAREYLPGIQRACGIAEEADEDDEEEGDKDPIISVEEITAITDRVFGLFSQFNLDDANAGHILATVICSLIRTYRKEDRVPMAQAFCKMVIETMEEVKND